MNCNAVVPTLERIALIRTAVILWNHDNITNAIKNVYYPLFYKYRELRVSHEDSLENRVNKWLKVEHEMKKVRLAMEEKVTDKVHQLPITNSLKEDLVSIIKPIGEEILDWIQCHGWYIGVELPSELCWLPRGIVDEKRTAKLLIKDENVDSDRRYKLACIYCLEEDIPKLWKKIPSTEKRNFYNEKGPYEVRQHELVIFWTYAIMGEMDKWEKMIKESLRRLYREHCSPFQRAAEDATGNHNEAATEYFLQKLTSAERKISLMKCAEILTGGTVHCVNYHFHTDNCARVFIFLLSQMNEQQQLEALQKHPYLPENFLDWPWQEYFMETAKCVLGDYINASRGCDVLKRILEKETERYKDYNYKNLFREFWQLISIHHEKIVKDYLVDRKLLNTLFLTGDKEYVKLILEDASTEVREQIIFSDEGKRICEMLLYDDKEDLLKFFVQMCISRKNLMKEFKNEFKKRIPNEVTLWNKFSEMLDGAFRADVKKRSSEERNANVVACGCASACGCM